MRTISSLNRLHVRLELLYLETKVLLRQSPILVSPSIDVNIISVSQIAL